MSVRSKLIAAGVCLAAAGAAAPVFLVQNAPAAPSENASAPMHADNNVRRDLVDLNAVVSKYVEQTGTAPVSATALHAAGVDFTATVGVNLTVVGKGSDYCLIGTSRLGTRQQEVNVLGSSTSVLYLVDGRTSASPDALCLGAVEGKFNSAGFQDQAS